MTTLTMTAALCLLMTASTYAWAETPALEPVANPKDGTAPVDRRLLRSAGIITEEAQRSDHLPTHPLIRDIHRRIYDLLNGPAAVSFVRGGATVCVRWPLP